MVLWCFDLLHLLIMLRVTMRMAFSCGKVRYKSKFLKMGICAHLFHSCLPTSNNARFKSPSPMLKFLKMALQSLSFLAQNELYSAGEQDNLFSSHHNGMLLRMRLHQAMARVSVLGVRKPDSNTHLALVLNWQPCLSHCAVP